LKKSFGLFMEGMDSEIFMVYLMFFNAKKVL
jgi:hypothetical protein